MRDNARFLHHDVTYLLDEPRVVLAVGMYLGGLYAKPQGLRHRQHPIRRRTAERCTDHVLVVALTKAREFNIVETCQPVSIERSAFCRLSANVRPIAIASPTDFIEVVSVWSAPGNFSNAKRGILVTT